MTDNHPDRPDGSDPEDTGSEPHDRRDREPGAHPQVERSGRSRTTGLLLVIALVAIAVMYALIWFGIVAPGR